MVPRAKIFLKGDAVDVEVLSKPDSNQNVKIIAGRIQLICYAGELFRLNEACEELFSEWKTRRKVALKEISRLGQEAELKSPKYVDGMEASNVPNTYHDQYSEEYSRWLEWVL